MRCPPAISASGNLVKSVFREGEWEIADLEPDERRRIRQEQAKPILDEFHDWLTRHRLQVPNGSSTAKAIDYSLKRWTALAHYLTPSQFADSFLTADSMSVSD